MKSWGIFLKELSKLLRKPSVIIILIIAPILIASIGSLMYANYGISNMRLGFVNKNKDPIGGFTVKLIISFFNGGSIIELNEKNYKDALLKGKAHAVIIIPEDFTKKVYAREQSYLYFVPSPYDLQIASGIYIVIKSLFDDLEGSMFFDPKVLKYLFVGKGYPAPDLISEGKIPLSLSSVMAPAVVFLSGVLVVITLSSLSIIEEKEFQMFSIYKISNVNYAGFAFSATLAYALLGMLESMLAYIAYHYLTDGVIDLKILFPLIVLSNLFYSYIGFIISAISPNKGVNVLLMTGTLMFVFMASGSLVPLMSMPEWLQKIIERTVIFNTTLAVRKTQIFGDISVYGQIMNIIIANFIAAVASVFASKYALRRE
ncbi:MAG: ABC transporter permease [Thermotogaceae bacterium]|nr:ABC transporter permease [Thermotogaceae bacterium]